MPSFEPVANVTWEQVMAYRLPKHHVIERTTPDHLIDVVSEMVGIHPQVAGSAELQLAARIDGLRPADVQDAPTPVVVVDGRVEGTCELTAGKRGGIAVTRLQRWRSGVETELAAEVDRIAAFLDRPLPIELTAVG